MGIFVQTFALTLLLGSCLAQFADYHVIYTDMNVAMKQFAVGNTLLLLSNGTDALLTTDKLVSTMNAVYGEGWFYRVGENTGFKGLTPKKNTTLQFQIKSTKVTISQLARKADSLLVNLEEIIQQAKKSSVIKAQGEGLGKNKGYYDIFTTKAKEVLFSSNKECVNITTTSQQEMCFYEMSSKLYNLIPKNLKISTEVGLYGDYFSYGAGFCDYLNDPYAFKIGDIYFIVRLIKDTAIGPIFYPDSC